MTDTTLLDEEDRHYAAVNASIRRRNAAAGRNIVREEYLMDTGFTQIAAQLRIAREERGDYSNRPGDKTLTQQRAG